MIQSINLLLPHSWNQCTTCQLELIADVLCEQLERADRYRPFSTHNVKIALFFALSGIEIVEGPNPRVPVEEQYYTCRLQSSRSRWFPFRKRGDTFSLYLWQINYWLSPKAKSKAKGTDTPESIASGAGVLDWFDNNNDSFLTKFPYSIIKRRHCSKWFSFGQIFVGPITDLDGFSWAQYRFATETMQSYTQINNNLLKMQQMNQENRIRTGEDRFTEEQMVQQQHSVDLAKAMFLATIFNAKTKFVDTNTGIVKHDFYYESNQCSDNAPYFRHFPDTQWQVILFWWTGIMHVLSKRYPHVFKVQKVKKSKESRSALDFYTATIATMQKYVGINEKECNNQSYTLVLEQLERISKENEDLERIRKKK